MRWLRLRGLVALSTPSLGITNITVLSNWWPSWEYFQLPLSGSPQALGRRRFLLPLPFNSLSRDHVAALRSPVVKLFTTPFQLPLSGSLDTYFNCVAWFLIGFLSFNSLSRDHAIEISSDLITWTDISDLSTPSLGITRGIHS
jgi:hypothetical protein